MLPYLAIRYFQCYERYYLYLWCFFSLYLLLLPIIHLLLKTLWFPRLIFHLPPEQGSSSNLSLYKSSPNLHNPAVLFQPLPTAIPVQAQVIVAMLRKPCTKGREFLTCG